MNKPRARYWLILPAVLGAVLAAGCDRDDGVSSYAAPKDPPKLAVADAGPQAQPPADKPDAPEKASLPPGHPAIPPPSAAGPSAPSDAPGGQPQWTVPTGWKPMQLGMVDFARFATNDDPEPLPATVTQASGDMQANVNRWEGQLALPPTPAADLKKVLHETQINGQTAFELDLQSPQANGKRMLVTIFPQGGESWFFKLFGPGDKVAAQKANYDAFVHSVKFGGAAATAAQPSAPTPFIRPPAAGPTAPPAASPETASSDPISYVTPEGWAPQPLAGPGAMGIQRVAAFTITSGNAKAEVTVIPLPLGSGDLKANINRWRGQVGLPGDDSAYQPKTITIDGVPSQMIDLKGPGGDNVKAKRMILAIRNDDQWSWFFKILGSEDVVSSQQPAFESFLKSVKFKAEAGK